MTDQPASGTNGGTNGGTIGGTNGGARSSVRRSTHNSSSGNASGNAPGSTRTATGSTGPAPTRRGLLWSRLFAVIALVALAFAIQRGYQGWQASAANALIDAGETRAHAPAEVTFAHALALDHKGRHDDALSAYAEAEVAGNDRIRHAVRVNVSNLYLRRGLIAAKDEGNAQRAMVLLQLAKAGYRRALRDDPSDWNARYNYELTLRILPDLEVRNWRRSGSESDIEDLLKKDKSAWTEMVGQPRGMH